MKSSIWFSLQILMKINQKLTACPMYVMSNKNLKIG